MSLLEALIIGGILFLLVKGGNLNISASTSPVIRNATGGSLSNVLGNKSQPPSAFATGQTGYAVQNNSVSTPNTHLAGPSASPSPTPVAFAQQPAIPNLANRTLSAAHNNVVYSTGVRPNVPTSPGPRVQVPPLVVAPTNVRVFNPATQSVVSVNPALTQGTISTAKNSPEVASPFWAATIKTRKIATY